MAKIGLDFGTTYSVISRIKEQQGGHVKVEACALREGGFRTEIQDSLVVKSNDGELLFGPSARIKVGRKGTVAYEGFKLMLAEKNGEMLRQRHYDNVFTPREIVSAYVGDLLKQYIATSGQDVIDKLVVGVPEIWFTNLATNDCRTTLKEIIQKSGYVREAELVSEPVAACAYFVQNYFETTGKKYEGKILIVDYGGGTLDIALCDVKSNHDGSSSEVKVIARAGEGWNTQGTVGKAGMAFMEEIVKIALRKAGFQDDEIVSDQKFFKCVHDIETLIMGRGGEIARTFKMNQLSKPESITRTFDSIEYKDEDYTVTYGMLAQAYNHIIRELLDKKLKDIMKYMDVERIDYSGIGKQDDFKIAMVGGFCNFYLTEKQIRDKFEDYADDDKRFMNIIADRRDSEKAVSYGAALIANEVVTFKQVAPYSLGFSSKSGGPWFAINKGDDIEFGKVKMFTGKNGEEMIFSGGSIPLLAFQFGDSTIVKEPLPEYKEKLKLEKMKCYKFGYSLDQSMVITLHKWLVPTLSRPDIVKEEEIVVLNEIYAMLGDLIVVGGKR